MNRRSFLKRAGALAVAGAFPLPVPAAPLTSKGVELVFDDHDPLSTMHGIERSKNVWWNTPAHPDFIVVGPAFMEAMHRVHREFNLAAEECIWRERLHLTR